MQHFDRNTQSNEVMQLGILSLPDWHKKSMTLSVAYLLWGLILILTMRTTSFDQFEACSSEFLIQLPKTYILWTMYVVHIQSQHSQIPIKFD